MFMGAFLNFSKLLPKYYNRKKLLANHLQNKENSHTYVDIKYNLNGQNAHLHRKCIPINLPFLAAGDTHHFCTADLDAMNNVWKPICSIILMHLSDSSSIAPRRNCF